MSGSIIIFVSKHNLKHQLIYFKNYEKTMMVHDFLYLRDLIMDWMKHLLNSKKNFLLITVYIIINASGFSVMFVSGRNLKYQLICSRKPLT